MKKTPILAFILFLFIYPQTLDASGLFDSQVTDYMSNVSGGIKVINNYTKEKTNAPIGSVNSFWNSLEEVTLENFDKVSGGLEYLIEDIFSVPAKGVSIIGSGISSYSNRFVSNITGNLKILRNGIHLMSANVSSGVQNNFSLILLKNESDSFKPLETSNPAALKESIGNMFEHFVFWLRS